MKETKVVKVLVVDDEEDLELLIRQKFRRRIRSGELEFMFAHNGKEGLLRLAQNRDIHLVFSDINMPVMDGLTLLSQLESADPDLCAVIISAYGDMPNIRAEFAAAGAPFEKRVGRMLEGLRLCRALWSGEPVDWDGRWTVKEAVLGPAPHNPGGPPVWLGTGAPAGLKRAARYFDGWFPTGPDAEGWGEGWRTVQAAAAEAGRPAGAVAGAVYLTLALDDDPAAGNARIDAYLERYYGAPAAVIRRRQTAFAGAPEAAADWIGGYAARGAGHIVLRFVGDHERMLEAVAGVRERIG